MPFFSLVHLCSHQTWLLRTFDFCTFFSLLLLISKPSKPPSGRGRPGACRRYRKGIPQTLDTLIRHGTGSGILGRWRAGWKKGRSTFSPLGAHCSHHYRDDGTLKGGTRWCFRNIQTPIFLALVISQKFTSTPRARRLAWSPKQVWCRVRSLAQPHLASVCSLTQPI